MRQLVERARRGDGPAFLHCHTYRIYGHHVGDINRAYYRSKEEEQLWKTEKDPIQRLADWLLAEGLTQQETLDQIQAEAKDEIARAAQFGINAPYPDAGEAGEDVYA